MPPVKKRPLVHTHTHTDAQPIGGNYQTQKIFLQMKFYFEIWSFGFVSVSGYLLILSTCLVGYVTTWGTGPGAVLLAHSRFYVHTKKIPKATQKTSATVAPLCWLALLFEGQAHSSSSEARISNGWLSSVQVWLLIEKAANLDSNWPSQVLSTV